MAAWTFWPFCRKGPEVRPKIALKYFPSGSSFRLYQLVHREGYGDLDQRAEQQATETSVDVVLVHGLTGDPAKTWGGKVKQIEGDQCLVGDCWPETLARDLKGKATFWTLGGEFPLRKSNERGSNLGFSDDASNALDTLAHKLNCRSKPIIFVAHSLGGLLVKKMLVQSASPAPREEYKARVLKRTFAVMFVGTPHVGSGLAALYVLPMLVKAASWLLIKLISTWIAVFLGVGALSFALLELKFPGEAAWPISTSILIGVVVTLLVAPFLRPSRFLNLLTHNNPLLHELVNQYRILVGNHPFTTESFYETEPLSLKFIFVKLKFLCVVPRHSADPGVAECVPISICANHTQMCKGENATAIVSRIRGHVLSAGGYRPVFYEYLEGRRDPERKTKKLLEHLVKDDGEYYRRFGEIPDTDQRKFAEDAWRKELRDARADWRFSAAQLDRSLHSGFDIDNYVWQMWTEGVTAGRTRSLAELADAELKMWPKEPRGPQDISLYSFYRPLRTVAHGLLLDQGSNRKALEDLIKAAEDKLNSEKWEALGDQRPDGGCRTRWLLLQLYCLVRMGRTVEDFLKTCEQKLEKSEQIEGGYRPGGGKLIRDEKRNFDARLEELEEALSGRAKHVSG